MGRSWLNWRAYQGQLKSQNNKDILKNIKEMEMAEH